MTHQADTIGVRGSAGKSIGRIGIARRLFALTFPVVALVVLLTQIVVGSLNYQDQLRALEGRAAMVAALTAEAIARPLWTLDRPIYEGQIMAIARDPTFRQARVHDETGKLILEHKSDDASPSDWVRVSVPIVDPVQKQTIGKFELALSSEELRKGVSKQFWIGAGAFLALVVGFFAASHLVVRSVILTPLAALLTAMEQVQQKHWVTLPVLRKDELGTATETFNRMVDGLRSGDEAQRLLGELQSAQRALQTKHDEVEKANRLILESIHYARNIQMGLLPDPNCFKDVVAESVIAWEPLHVVGGDYLWLERRGHQALIFVADCTGHGVPGAFMTMVVAAALETVLGSADTLPAPAALLTEMDTLVRRRLRQDREDTPADDGMDAACCILDLETSTLTYAGAGIPLVLLRDGGVEEIRGDRASLGYRSLRPKFPLRDHTVQLSDGDAFYLFTDGVSDHLGGSPRRLFGRSQIREVLLRNAGAPLATQLAQLKCALDAYRGHEPRRDDLALVGIRPRPASSSTQA